MHPKIANSGLLDRDLDNLCQVAMLIPEIEEIYLFGSRAKGTHKRGSDIDLAIAGREVRYETVIRFASKLNEESPLPYFFDVVDRNAIQELSLKEHIDRVGILIYKRA